MRLAADREGRHRALGKQGSATLPRWQQRQMRRRDEQSDKK
jgi:hypothetical protein